MWGFGPRGVSWTAEALEPEVSRRGRQPCPRDGAPLKTLDAEAWGGAAPLVWEILHARCHACSHVSLLGDVDAVRIRV